MLVLEQEVDVAKKKAKAPAGDVVRKPMILQVRGSEGYRTWLENAARKDGLSLAALVDRALRFYIREQLGIKDDPPPR